MEKLVQKCYYLDFTLYVYVIVTQPYNPQGHIILRLFENSPDFILDKMQLKVMVLHALQRLHGQVGTNPQCTHTGR